MYKLTSILSLIVTFTITHAGGFSDINWISKNCGSWFDATNWEEGVIPFDGVDVRFGVNDIDLSRDEVDIDDFSNSFNLTNSLIRLERKVTFNDGFDSIGVEKDKLIFMAIHQHSIDEWPS